MADIVERLRAYACEDHERLCRGREYDCTCGYDGRRDPLLKDAADEINRLRVENIQMQAALGYGILAEDERHIIPSNPYKCGTCDARKHLPAENDRLRAALEEIECGLSGAAMEDCEHGLRVLNERAAASYLHQYPHTNAAISSALKTARAALGETT